MFRHARGRMIVERREPEEPTMTDPLPQPIKIGPDVYACTRCSSRSWVDVPGAWHCDDCDAAHAEPDDLDDLDGDEFLTDPDAAYEAYRDALLVTDPYTW